MNYKNTNFKIQCGDNGWYIYAAQENLYLHTDGTLGAWKMPKSAIYFESPTEAAKALETYLDKQNQPKFGEWVSTKDRLPNHHKLVLCRVNNKWSKEHYFDTVSYNTIDQEWEDYDNEQIIEWTSLPDERLEPIKPATYIEGHRASGIYVGDRVRVIRKANSLELGWNNSWAESMDIAVGNTYTVKIDSGEQGFSLDISGGYLFPYFVLEKVNK